MRKQAPSEKSRGCSLRQRGDALGVVGPSFTLSKCSLTTASEDNACHLSLDVRLRSLAVGATAKAQPANYQRSLAFPVPEIAAAAFPHCLSESRLTGRP